MIYMYFRRFLGVTNEFWMLQRVSGSPRRVMNIADIKEGFWRWLGRLRGSVQEIKGP